MMGTIENEYYLRNRKKILKEMMKSFKNGNKEVFINLVAIQIEGIFEDYCISIGALKQENTFTLVEKVRRAEENIILYGYEYFAFDFPKIRNKIAHAKIIEDDIVNLANELFLDLNYVLNLFNQKYLDTTIIRNFIQKFESINKDVWIEHIVKSINNKAYFEFLFGNEYDDLLRHYDLIKKREQLIHQLNEEVIWNSVLEKIEDAQDRRYNEKFHDDFKKFSIALRKKGLFTEYIGEIFEYFNEVRKYWEYGFVTETEEDDEDWRCNWWNVWQVK